jgi:glycosyl-4,4'-diaponeurosporenoate acyltransferase
VNEIIKYLLLNIGTWVLWFYIVGFFASKLKDSFLSKDYSFTNLHKIDKWKDRVPELGGVFGDGFQKRSIDLGTRDQLELFIRETRRAELAHWVMTGGWIITLAFNPLWAIVFNLVFAHIVNFPCLIIQRYNRARLIKVLENRT